MLPIFIGLLEDAEDQRAFAELYQRYYGKMAAVAARYFPEDPQEAEDALHNAFLQVIRHFEKVSSLSCDVLPFWLVSIVKNESITLLRRRRRVVPLEDWGAFEQAAEDGELGARTVAEVIRAMPETYRAALELRFLEERSEREIARALDLSESAVKSRISRGRALLVKRLQEEGITP